jgi:hypothetical protein
MQIVVFLMVLWILFAFLGIFIKGLFWLTILGILLFVATGASWLRSRR